MRPDHPGMCMIAELSHKDCESCGGGVMLAIESSISNKFLPSPNHLE